MKFPKDIISTRIFTKEHFLYLFDLANFYLTKDICNDSILSKKIVGTIFFQPSTRTRLNFEVAVLRLGGKIVGLNDIHNTRAGDFFQETFEDTIQVVAQMVDMIVIRHFIDNAAYVAAQLVDIPIINAGDGGNEHPTQALCDLWVMSHLLGELDNKRIGLVGDLNNRALRSLIIGLSAFNIKEFSFLMPPNLIMPNDIHELLKHKKISWTLYDDITDVLCNADIIEMIPIFLPNYRCTHDSTITDKKLEARYILDNTTLQKTKKNIPILHPGPRMSELSVSLDKLSNFYYFKQVKLSLYMRMAILNAFLP